MKKLIILSILSMVSSGKVNAQESGLERFEFLIGHYAGTGEGFSSGQSRIQSSFEYVMDKKYIKVTNHSVFEPNEENPEGSMHEDWGIISYDRNRKAYVFRQFHSEGYVNQYVLNDSLSNDTTFIFESEDIENFVEGGTARFTIHKHKKGKIETVFDVSFPGRGYTCYGRNDLFLNNDLH
jgi:hypothetical protein